MSILHRSLSRLDLRSVGMPSIVVVGVRECYASISMESGGRTRLAEIVVERKAIARAEVNLMID